MNAKTEMLPEPRTPMEMDVDGFLDELDASSQAEKPRKVTISLDGGIAQVLDEFIGMVKSKGTKLSQKQGAAQLIRWGYELYKQREQARLRPQEHARRKGPQD